MENDSDAEQSTNNEVLDSFDAPNQKGQIGFHAGVYTSAN